MAVKQISVYAENKKGVLAGLTGCLAAADVDLKSICVADTAEFGIFRMIATDTDKALTVLRDSGYTASAREIAAVAVPNRPGELDSVLQLLASADINIEYMYSIISNKSDMAYMALRVSDTLKTELYLKDNGYSILTEKDI